MPGSESSEHLSRVERVIVKDSWNKFLAFDEMLTEMFFERLILDAPELADQFGAAIDQAPTEFLALFDRAVRALDRSTEVALREAYRSAPGAEGARCADIASAGSFFATYGLTAEHWRLAGRTFVWAMGKAPYLEDFERDNLARGDGSAIARFFAAEIARPMIAHVEAEERALAPGVVADMQAGAEAMLAHPQDAGIFFYQTLFRTHPEVLRHFRTADMDMLSRHLIETVVFLSRAAATRPKNLRQELRNLGQIHQSNAIPPADYPKLAGPLLETLGAFGLPLDERTRRGWETLFGRVIRIISEPMAQQEKLTKAAREFIDQVASELGWSQARLDKRWSEVTHEIRATGSYTHAFEELEHGARLAWRNAPKCIGRISWKNLIVRDRRYVVDPDEMFAECVEHLRAATNGGNIEIVLTLFRPTRPGERWGPRIWNSQLIRYAGHQLADGSVVGDRANLDLTAAIRKLGWEPPAEPTDFDVLPIVIDMPGHEPRVYHFDPAEVLEVSITHPTAPAIAELGLKWCAVPAIANFRLDIGGINYGCLPFNGWFMGTEIARNLWEEKRYDRAAQIAAALELDTSSEATLWRDRAFLELNVAIVHSFQQARVTLVDHQTASRQFMIHDLREKKAGRECPAQWSWIAPAAGGATTPVWHHEMRDFQLRPAYAYAADRWQVADRGICPAREIVAAPEARTRRPLILYASETGTAEGYARQAARRLGGLAPQVLSMDEVDVDQIARESLVLVIASTCRDGDAPANGQAFLDWLRSRKPGALVGVGFSVLGIGNRIYPKFCAAAVAYDAAFEAAGAERIAKLDLADEISGQSDTVKQWLEMFAKLWSADGQAVRARRAVVEIVPPARPPAVDPARIGRVAFNDEMLGPDAGPGRSTRHIGIDLPAGADAYEAGDHLAICPVNPDRLVDGVCRHLGLPRDAWFRILGASAHALDRFRGGYPVERLLAQDLDLGMPTAPEELLAAMRAASRDLDDQMQLDRWIAKLNLDEADPARAALREWLRETYHSLLDLFEAFPQSVPPIDVLIELLPRLKPRLYSIGSSPRVHPRQARIMAGVLTLPSRDGRSRRGLCSHYLSELAPGTALRIAVKSAPRRLPADFVGPLLLVGAGTGLAPLYGIMQDRVARGARASSATPAALYAGFRGEDEFLQRADLIHWREQGHLSRLSVAYSRKGPAKAYVQDAIDGDGATAWDVIRRPDSHLIICGDAKMAQDVEERLLQVIQREGSLGYPGALALLQQMKGEGRFIEDVWGVQLNRDVALPEVVRAKYDRGAGWFARLGRALAGRRGDAGSIERW
ncbi:nitric oxide synthase oxygenase [Amaricoccus sp.]|uniref:nitric oxide synthase oxygenase n=1 Tax=Amaricoccus sp. TaxID=1872485 RepID=UPI001B76A5A9|nr:nitric oxide synthase oxygenase [Amaricoccus sp.]MBP7242605.1 nitric oxide synthase oxygenase [Amaricoccus sp.]